MIRFVHFVDRNVISQIKDQTLSEENERLLRSLDRKDSRISPLIASFEGQVGVLQTVDQLKESIAKDTVALSGFFENAYTDDMAKIAHGSTTDPALMTSVLDAIGKLMLNADQRKTGNPAGQLFRMLQALYLSGKIGEKDMLELSARIGRIQLRLDGLAEEG